MDVSSLVIDGTEKGKRFRVIYNGWDYLLQPKLFSYLAILANYRVTVKDGWTPIEAFDEPNETLPGKYIYRLRRDTPIPIVRKSGAHGLYRLEVNPQGIIFNRKKLSQYWDSSVSGLFI